MLALAGGVHNTKRHLIFIALILPTTIVSANATNQCPNKPEFERTSLTTAFIDSKTMTMYSSGEAGPSTSTSASGMAKRIRRADSSTIQDKFLVGYQAWFHCPGDGEPIYEGHHGWIHWFNAPPEHGGHINTDLWPDFSEYDADELYPAPGMRYANGEQVYLYSNRNAKTIQRHFHWMATHSVDGAMLQRFLNIAAPGNEGSRKLRDDIGDLVRDAAEKEGRTYAIMYDVSGIPNDMVHDLLIEDWKHLLRNKDVLASPNYLHEDGKPVIVLWGFGLGDRGHTPATVRAVAQSMRAASPGGDAYIMAGVAAGWRTGTADADPDPELTKVWLEEYDAISPWTIGRYNSEESADAFARERMRGDVDAINAHNERVRESGEGRKVDYVPVIQPGSSGHNTSHGQWNFNDAKRNGGRFLWRQIYNARKLGVRTMYGAMWDEYDEGTAYMPVVAHKRQLPIMGKTKFMALDEDGYHDLTPDWYMRIAGFAAEVLKGERSVHETFPVKDLYDYWASRPKYEYYDPAAEEAARNEWARERDKKLPSLPTAVDGFGNDKDGEEDVPPPPYSLEDDTPAPAPVVASPPPSSSSSSFPPPVVVSPRPAIQPVQDSTIAALSEDFARQASFGSSSSIATSSSSSSSRPPPPPRHPFTRPLTYTPSAALHPPPRHPSVSSSPSPSSTSPGGGLPPPVPQQSRPGSFVGAAPSSPPPPLALRPAQGLGSQSSLPYAPYSGSSSRPGSAMIPQPQDDREEYLHQHQHHHSHSHSQHHQHHHHHGSSPSGSGGFAPPSGPPPGSMRPQSTAGYGPSSVPPPRPRPSSPLPSSSSQSTCPPMPEPMSPTSPSLSAPHGHGHGGYAPVFAPPSSSSPPIPRPNPSPSPGPGGQGGRYNPPPGPPPPLLPGMSSYGPPPGPPPMQGQGYGPSYGGSPGGGPYAPYAPYAPYSSSSPPPPPPGGGGGPMAFPQAQPYYAGGQQQQQPPPPPQFGLPPGQQYHYQQPQQQQQQQGGGQSRLTPQSVVNRVWGMLNSI